MSEISADVALVVEGEHDDVPQALPIGFVIGGKYEVKRVLGVGGNGAVYEGEHNAVGHRVAIKVVHLTRVNRDEIMARFRREARICGSLRHPNVGQVYDVGALDDGAPYMVMELQEGRSLGDVIDETKLPIAAVIDIGRQLLSGLGAAHQAGVIHRDVKPDNVMIVRDRGGEVVVKLVDFGISMRLDARNADGSVTAEGIIIGSPDYMPPEQLRGSGVDTRTDLYAVGVLLYEAITGRTPFDGDTLSDLVAAVLRDSVTRPTALRGDCPASLERIVIKAMSRDPSVRYQSADEMSRALAEVRPGGRNTPSGTLAHLSHPPPRDSVSVRTRRRRTIDSHTLEGIRVHTGVAAPTRKRRSTMMAAMVLAVAGLAAFMSARSVPKERVVATQLSSAAAANAPPPSAAVDSTPLAPVPQATPTALRVESPAVPEPASSPVTAEAPLPRKPRVRPSEAQAPRSQVPSTGAVSASEPDPQATQALLKQATNAFAVGQTAQARSLYQEVVRMNPRQADAWRGLGVVSSQLGARAEAVRAFRRYLELRPSAADAERVRQQLQKLQ